MVKKFGEGERDDFFDGVYEQDEMCRDDFKSVIGEGIRITEELIDSEPEIVDRLWAEYGFKNRDEVKKCLLRDYSDYGEDFNKYVSDRYYIIY